VRHASIRWYRSRHASSHSVGLAEAPDMRAVFTTGCIRPPLSCASSRFVCPTTQTPTLLQRVRLVIIRSAGAFGVLPVSHHAWRFSPSVPSTSGTTGPALFVFRTHRLGSRSFCSDRSGGWCPDKRHRFDNHASSHCRAGASCRGCPRITLRWIAHRDQALPGAIERRSRPAAGDSPLYPKS